MHLVPLSRTVIPTNLVDSNQTVLLRHLAANTKLLQGSRFKVQDLSCDSTISVIKFQ